MVRNDDCDTSRASGGFENPTFSSGDSNELVSLGLVPIEKKVDDLLVRHELSFVTRSEWQDKMLVQVFVLALELLLVPLLLLMTITLLNRHHTFLPHDLPLI